jgi:hypothetical protein
MTVLQEGGAVEGRGVGSGSPSGEEEVEPEGLAADPPRVVYASRRPSYVV